MEEYSNYCVISELSCELPLVDPMSMIDLVLTSKCAQRVSDMRKAIFHLSLRQVLSDEQALFSSISEKIKDWPDPNSHSDFILFALSRTTQKIRSMSNSDNKVYMEVQMNTWLIQNRPSSEFVDEDEEDEFDSPIDYSDSEDDEDFTADYSDNGEEEDRVDFMDDYPVDEVAGWSSEDEEDEFDSPIDYSDSKDDEDFTGDYSDNGEQDEVAGWSKMMEEATCSVCLEDLHSDAVLTPCAHVFHRLCIFKWLVINSYCPNCRSQIFLLEE